MKRCTTSLPSTITWPTGRSVSSTATTTRCGEPSAIRRCQSAFHPNATQFTLHLGNQLFGFWRQSRDRRQSIFCISNVSAQEQVLQLADVNLIEHDSWMDLITGMDVGGPNWVLAPYATVWLTNRPDHR